MEQYQIVPWDDLLTEESSGMNLEQYVPPELEELANQVCKFYAMDVRSMQLITSKPDKGGAIWRIETNHGPRSLKVLHRTPARSLFSVGAQEYVVKKGARVPAIIHTIDGRNSVVAGGKLWIVTDWIDSLTPVAKIDLEGAQTLVHGLGEFHQWSKGYVPPLEAGKSSRIFKWESQYQKIMTKIGWFRHIARAYPDTAASSKLLSVVDTFETQAKEIFARFQASAYQKMIRKGEAHWGLAHQDYGWSNGQMGPGGIWVIDLDGVAFDLPIRDLRKIITSTMDDMGTWDLAWIRGVIDAYHRANPLDRETFELLWIDMAFPNEFYKHVKEVVFSPVEFMNTELDAILDRVLMTEANKWEVLRELEKDMEKYPAGDYTEIEAVPSQPYSYRDYVRREAETAQPAKPVKPARPERAERSESRIIRLVVQPDGSVKLFEGPKPVETGAPARNRNKAQTALPLPIIALPVRNRQQQPKQRHKPFAERPQEQRGAARTVQPARQEKTAKPAKPARSVKPAKPVKPAKTVKAAKSLKKAKRAAKSAAKSAAPLLTQPRAAQKQPNSKLRKAINNLRTEAARQEAMKLLKSKTKSSRKTKKAKTIRKAAIKSFFQSSAAPSGKAYISAFRSSANMREKVI
ncbi:CotS family spore coat protein [Paenibacillus nanensis]|uniref:CotS family spore coat protein n=1 Tax=Paenibacillus nanensis TaxID=393251 RepID=UPI0019806B37|nr:CotS family spore coat protein [Paenibacillus nanensis]